MPVIAALVFSGVLTAQTPPPVAAASSNPDPSLSTSPAPAPPKRDRPISDGVASSLAASMPKYNPPPKPKPQDDIDSREVDKPKNGIIRLPKYTVQEKKPPVFRERDIYTAGGLADLARKRYLTRLDLAMNSFYIPFLSSSPEERAMAMYAEDERLNNMSDLKDAARTVGQSDPAGSQYIKRVSDDTYLRSGGSGYESGPGARH
jgi:hypothetical protein